MRHRPILAPLSVGLLATALIAPAHGDQPKPDPERLRQTVSDLSARLASGDTKEREQAAESLWQLGPLAGDAALRLNRALKDDSQRVRLYAAGALLRVDQTASKKALPVLVEVLRDPKGPFLEGLFVCGRLEPTDRELIAGLLDMVRDDHPIVLVAGSTALDNVGPAAKDAAPLFEEALKDKKAEVRLSAGAALLRIDPSWKKQVQPVAEAMLRDADVSVLVRAADTLTTIDPAAAAKAVEPLAAALESPKLEDRLTVAALLVELTPEKSPAVVNAVAGGLKDADAEARTGCARKLGQLGRYAESADKALLAAADDKDPDAAVAAAEALLRVAPQRAGDLLPALAERRDRRDQTQVAALLKQIDALAAVIDETIKKEKQPESRRRLEKERLKGLAEQVSKPAARTNGDLMQLHAAVKLAQLGPGAKDAVSSLAGALDDADSLLRGQIIFALGKVGPDAATAFPALLRVYRDRRESSVGLRREAAEALRAIDPEAAKKEGVR